MLPVYLATISLVFLGLAPIASAIDKLVIISPHRKSIQDEFIPKFKTFYAETYKTSVEVEWLDNGGTTDAVRLLRTRFDKSKTSSGIDILWGGGTNLFIDLEQDHLLQAYPLPATLRDQVPQQLSGVPFYDSSKTWVATALSSYGILYNKKILGLEGLKEPTKWSDLANPMFKNQLSAADPRHSGTAMTMIQIVLNASGWTKGWELLAGIAGNTRSFTHSSSDPIKAVVAGDAAAAMVIDFYAQPKIEELGKDNLGFVLPVNETVIDPDPVAIIRGAPHLETAQRFVAFVLSVEAQKLLILPKGAPGGPKLASLGRMAVNKQAYLETEGKRSSPFNPFKQNSFLHLNAVTNAKMVHVLSDLIGAIQIDTHSELKAAWAAIIKRGMRPAEVAEFALPPVSEKEALALCERWSDNTVRNANVNAWVAAAKAKYLRLAAH